MGAVREAPWFYQPDWQRAVMGAVREAPWIYQPDWQRAPVGAVREAPWCSVARLDEERVDGWEKRRGAHAGGARRCAGPAVCERLGGEGRGTFLAPHH